MPCLHVPPAQTFLEHLPFYSHRTPLSIHEPPLILFPPLFYQRLLNSRFSNVLQYFYILWTPDHPSLALISFGTALPYQGCSAHPSSPDDDSSNFPSLCSFSPEFVCFLLDISLLLPCLFFFFFSFNCMIIYIPLLFSFYSFIALCFPTTLKPKVVLTPGLEQILYFF